MIPRPRFSVYIRMVEHTCWPPWSMCGNHLSCNREYTGCESRFSTVCLFIVATLETIYNTWVILSTCPIFQLLLERPLPVSWHSNYSYIQRPQDSLQGLGYSIDKWYEHCCLSPLILGLSISRSHRLLRLPLLNPGQVVVDEACRIVIGKQLLFDFGEFSLLLFFVC